MRLKSKVIEIPANATIAQMESALDTHLNNGWELKSVFTLATKVYAIIIKVVAV